MAKDLPRDLFEFSVKFAVDNRLGVGIYAIELVAVQIDRDTKASGQFDARVDIHVDFDSWILACNP
ncbi:hypothetical protein PTT_11295 [Pyrenophora teres f. teres 0-1]|uniref:Uncharacterized protein n=1 Tax=Pyrenophora teres f. teres (strain 0-1) TaxID=861557 RepID=E3RR83_PYRTT|nr:hypothetical protein PTT_11295 [Pyrenophora teres f. teres 0-1]